MILFLEVEKVLLNAEIVLQIYPYSNKIPLNLGQEKKSFFTFYFFFEKLNVKAQKLT